MSETYTTTKKRLHVQGLLWDGSPCEHDYPLHVIGRPDLEGVEPKGSDHVKLIAGDFQSIELATLIITEQVITETVTETKIV